MSGQPPYYEDLSVGMEIPMFSVTVRVEDVQRFAGVNDRPASAMHTDSTRAREIGLPSAIVPGPLKCAYLGNMLTNWLRDHVWIMDLAVDFKEVDQVNSSIVAKGVVRELAVRDGKHIAECEVWIENAQGRRTSVGAATLAVLSRSEA